MMKTLIVLGLFLVTCGYPLSDVCACETRNVAIKGALDRSAPLTDIPVDPAQAVEEAQLTGLFDIIDILGESHTITLLFFHTSIDEWIVNAYGNASDVGGTPGQLVQFASAVLFFEEDGTRPEPLPSDDLVFTANWSNGARPGWYQVSFADFTQGETASVITSITQDGKPGACTQNGTLDFDGDGRDDIAIWRPTLGMWAIRKSSTQSAEFIWKQWGLAGDYPMPGDFTGDGKTDLAVWRPSDGNWYVCTSESDFDCNQSIIEQFGLPGDRPLKGDYDGDHKLDFAVWRPAFGMFIHKSSSTGEIVVQQWGLPGDIPLGTGVDN